MSEIAHTRTLEIPVPGIEQSTPPSVTTQTTTETTATTQSTGPSWLSGQLRNFMALAITGVVCYLALSGNDQAMSAVIATFAVLAGAIWGERAATKNPNRRES